MQKGFTGIFILIGIMVLAGITAGAYYFGKLPIKPKDNPKACTMEAKICPDGSFVGRAGPNCEFSPCPSVVPKTSDETSNWKTYTNTKYNYSLKYPSSWKIRKELSETFSIESLDKEVSQESGYIAKGAGINIDAEKTSLTSLDEIYEAYLKKNKTYIDRRITTIISKESITINEIPALKIVTQTIDAPNGFDIRLFYNQTSIVIQFWEVNSNYQNLFDQILSTFKFLP